MASRPELVQMCLELGLEHKDKFIEEMTVAVKLAADAKFDKTFNISIEDISDTLLKFLIMEYDYIIRSKDGTIYNYKKEKIE